MPMRLYAANRPLPYLPERDMTMPRALWACGYLRTLVGIDLVAVGSQVFGWISGADINTALTTLMTVVTVGATAYVVGSKIIHEGRLKQQAEAWEQQRKQKLQQEADDRDSLAAQLKSLSASLDESTANQERMRATLHDLRNEAAARRLEAEELRDDLAQTLAQLQAANLQIAQMRRETPPVVEKAAERGARKAINDSQSEMPASEPESSPTTRPNPTNPETS